MDLKGIKKYPIKEIRKANLCTYSIAGEGHQYYS
jgi:hypothetical protein